MGERTQGPNPGDEFEDGQRLRQYPVSGSSGFISGSKVLCDACAAQGTSQAMRHWARPSDNCEHPQHQFNVVTQGVEEPSEYEHYKDHPDVVGWARDDFTSHGEDHTLCTSCAEDRRSSGGNMEPYYPLTKSRLMPDDSCKECGHSLHAGRKQATRRRAISEAEERALTNLAPLDLDRSTSARCTRCGTTLGPGESGLCPNCQNDGAPRQRHRQRQMLVMRNQGAKMNMLAVLDRIWAQGSNVLRGDWRDQTPAIDRVKKKYDDYQGLRTHVPIANNTWAHKDTDGNLHVRHHSTDILSFSPQGHITIDTGGWDSTTTKSRINALLPPNMKLMRNPSKARGAPERVIAHNPNGGGIFGSQWRQNAEGEYERDDSQRGKYGLHRDTVLHPYHDGFSIDSNSGEILPDHHVQAGTPARPPNARGSEDPGPRASAPRSRSRYPENYYGHDVGHYPGGYGTPSTPAHEQVPTHEQIRRDLQQTDREQARHPGGDTYDSSHTFSPNRPAGYQERSHGIGDDDLPQEGESYDDWINRTTTAPKNVPCPSCKGKGRVRPAGPVPPGVQPWEHREDCKNCGGSGLVPTPKTASLTRVLHAGHLLDGEGLTRRYLAGLQRLAYGETKAPQQVDTLRDDICPICGDSDAYDGDQCQICGFVAPPKMFQDPDLERAKLLDLRADPATGAPNDVDPTIGDNVGQNLPPVSPDDVDEDGSVDGDNIEGQEAGQEPDEDGVVEGDVHSLGDADEPAEPDDVDEDGEVVNSPDDAEAPQKRINQGGEPFTKGPNAPDPEEPMDPAEVEAEEDEEDGEDGAPVADDGQQESQGDAGLPGAPGDGVADLACPACGFEAGAASPTSTPGNVAIPANDGDGMLEGDICPNCQKATLMGTGALQPAVP